MAHISGIFRTAPTTSGTTTASTSPFWLTSRCDGKPVKALVQAHRNGYFYCLNRENGEFLYGKPFCEVTWTDRTKGADGLDPKTGRPFVNPAALPTEAGVRVCPGAAGGKEWNPMAYDPGTGFAFVSVINNCAKFTSGKAFFIKGQPYWGSSLTLIDNQASGAFKAIEAATGQIKWEVATRSPMVAGVLATGGGIVFTGDAEGFFTAYETQTGKVLWNFQCGSGHHSGPITYSLDGRQYIAVCVGWGGWTAGFAGDGAPGCATPAAETRCSFLLFPRGKQVTTSVPNPPEISIDCCHSRSQVERLQMNLAFQSARSAGARLCSQSSLASRHFHERGRDDDVRLLRSCSQGLDDLCDTRRRCRGAIERPMALRGASTWPSPQAIGRILGRTDRVPLVCKCGLRLALPA